VDDAKLVEIWKGKDREAAATAFRTLYARHWARAVRIASRFVVGRGEDAAQEGFIRVLKSREDVRSFKAYLTAAVISACLDVQRKKSDLLIALAASLPEDHTAFSDRPDDPKLRVSVLLIRTLVQSLANPQREILVDHYFGGLTVEELATKYQLLPRKVRDINAKALQVLREGLERIFSEEVES